MLYIKRYTVTRRAILNRATANEAYQDLFAKALAGILSGRDWARMARTAYQGDDVVQALVHLEGGRVWYGIAVNFSDVVWFHNRYDAITAAVELNAGIITPAALHRGVRRQAARYRTLDTDALNAALRHNRNHRLSTDDHLKRAQARAWWNSQNGDSGS